MGVTLAEAYSGQVWCAVSSTIPLQNSQLTVFQGIHKQCTISQPRHGNSSLNLFPGNMLTLYILNSDFKLLILEKSVT